MWLPEMPALKVLWLNFIHGIEVWGCLYVWTSPSAEFFSKNRAHLMTLAQANSALLEAAAPLSEWLWDNTPSAH